MNVLELDLKFKEGNKIQSKSRLLLLYDYVYVRNENPVVFWDWYNE